MNAAHGSYLPLFLGLLLSACGGGVPLVARGPHAVEEEERIRIDEPAPPPRASVIPLQRDERCRWVDGAWERRGRSWSWVPGRWVLPEDGCYFAAPTTSFDHEKEGLVLNYYPGIWYRKGAQEKCEEPPRCGALREESLE